MKIRPEHESYMDLASLITLVLTGALFILAVFLKGFTHDLLLEVGVFLVSVKVVISSAQADLRSRRIERSLAQLHEMMRGDSSREPRK